MLIICLFAAWMVHSVLLFFDSFTYSKCSAHAHSCMGDERKGSDT